MLEKSARVVLASFRASTGTRPPHHSAARTDVVLLIRRTVRPRGYGSDLRSLQPSRTGFLSILPEYFSMFQIAEPSDFRLAMAVFIHRDREAYGN
jgi:hypothetical protein